MSETQKANLQARRAAFAARVPKADVAAAEAYGRSEEAKVAKWLSFEREFAKDPEE